jgi:hypothetical protein
MYGLWRDVGEALAYGGGGSAECKLMNNDESTSLGANQPNLLIWNIAARNGKRNWWLCKCGLADQSALLVIFLFFLFDFFASHFRNSFSFRLGRPIGRNRWW